MCSLPNPVHILAIINKLLYTPDTHLMKFALSFAELSNINILIYVKSFVDVFEKGVVLASSSVFLNHVLIISKTPNFRGKNTGPQ